MAPKSAHAVAQKKAKKQKRILIGSGGTRIRTIGKTARAKVEAFVGAPVYLDLWVKVLANWRRAASYVDRIFKGAKPGDLPVEKPTAFELVVNLKAAGALRVTIAPTLLQQATQVVQ